MRVTVAAGAIVDAMIDRHDAVVEAMDDIRRIEAAAEPNRYTVEQIRDRLVELAANTHLFSLEDLTPPGPGQEANSVLYRLAEDPDHRFALYANASDGEVSTPAHNHTTWAVVVGVSGSELNRFYQQTDDGGIVESGQHLVEPGTGVAMLGDDLHSIHLELPAMNLHCYGLALEQLHDRRYYHNGSGEWRTFPASSNIVDARG